ncbi:hypothetical protein [uncultured Pedobacter sp.]|uniref:hypothetical protein n=1 Tax=uncultured Pedobacter sp. TaxID=246139 RepID=UPI00261087D8|nr:hypothetical protein [uncultured Pedobacter sp.]
MEAELIDLKTKLQSLGALRPEVWERIVQLCQHSSIKANESFLRKEGSLAYVAEGVLKEYNPQHRKKPAIINFIVTKQCIITRSYNQTHYLKACTATSIYHWDINSLKLLYQEFEELKKIYDRLCAEYDEGLAYGRLILEEKAARQRVVLLMNRYRPQLNLISKKDLSHYLMLNYDYFTLLLHELI